MRTLGNIIWHIPFLGFVSALGTFFLGCLLVITIIGAPIGFGLIQLSKFLLAPFSNSMVDGSVLEQDKNKLLKSFGFIVRILYFPLGLFLAIVVVFQIAGLFISIIGIPVALVLAKSLSTFFNPINKKCVPISTNFVNIQQSSRQTVNEEFIHRSTFQIPNIESMAIQKVNIFSDAWIDIIFEGRNKEYGAYALRKLSSRRHRFALIATIIFALVAFTAPGLIETIIPERVERNVEVTNLANIELEKNKVKEIEVPIEIEKQEVIKIKSTIKFTAPVIKDDALVKDEDVMKMQEDVIESKLSISAADVQGNSTDTSAVDISDLQLDQSQVTDEAYEKPFTIVEQMPEFPGGQASMMKYIATNVKYPAMARETGISGNVFVSFVVNRKGEIKDVKVLRGIGGGCDEEAIRVVMSMPNWIPGKQNGKPVPVQFNLPIKFILK